MTSPCRLGILGGTFDPVHRGHLDAAVAAREVLGLDRVVFMPAHVPPHRLQPVASGYHRFAMVALALQELAGCSVSDLELQAAGPSYTAVTLRRLHARGFRPTQLFFITGIDAFAEIATWHDYPAVLEAAHFVVISRPGYAHDNLGSRLPELFPRLVDLDAAGTAQSARAGVPHQTSIFLVTAPTADISATEVRRRLASGEPLGGMTPDAVVRYAREHNLYAPTTFAANLLHDQD
jgi:nicotinate-nucleotide adenylyltransferase